MLELRDITGELPERITVPLPTAIRDENGKIVHGTLNIYGKPKGARSMSTLLRDMLHAQDDNGRTIAQDILATLTTQAMRGDMRASQLVLAYSDGLPATMKSEQTVNTPLVIPSEIIAKYKLNQSSTNIDT